MGIPSKEPDGMEARVARLESDVAHIRGDVAELKTDVRSLRDRMDVRFDTLGARLDAMNRTIDARFIALETKFDGKHEATAARLDNLAESLASAKVWALLLYIALAGALLGTLARGFGWL